jgi:hypothetical protein
VQTKIPTKQKPFVLVKQVKGAIFFISKMTDRSWKCQFNQEVYWFWFQCIQPLSNILATYFSLATYFNLALDDPQINLDAVEGVMPTADDKMLKDIAKHFKQLSQNIKAEMVDGNGHPLANSTPSMWLEACPWQAECY